MSNRIDLTGRKFGRLTVTEGNGVDFRGEALWKCTCTCGKKTIVSGSNLRYGRIISCGCYRIELQTKHGKSHTGTYSSWRTMMGRCSNHNYSGYKNYGGRGIAICDRWLVFENFYADMGERPKGLTIERINNDKGYSPDNCKWASMKEQRRNSRQNKLVCYKNKNQSIAAWAEELGLSYPALWQRLKKYSPQIAFNM